MKHLTLTLLLAASSSVSYAQTSTAPKPEPLIALPVRPVELPSQVRTAPDLPPVKRSGIDIPKLDASRLNQFDPGPGIPVPDLPPARLNPLLMRAADLLAQPIAPPAPAK